MPSSYLEPKTHLVGGSCCDMESLWITDSWAKVANLDYEFRKVHLTNNHSLFFFTYKKKKRIQKDATPEMPLDKQLERGPNCFPFVNVMRSVCFLLLPPRFYQLIPLVIPPQFKCPRWWHATLRKSNHWNQIRCHMNMRTRS